MQRRSISAFGDGLQKLGRWLRDAVIAQQRFAQGRWRSFRSRNLFLAGGPKRVNDFLHKLWIVCRVYRKRIADLKTQSPSGQVEFKMARILCRLRPAQAAIDQKFGGKRVCPRIREERQQEASACITICSGDLRSSQIFIHHFLSRALDKHPWRAAQRLFPPVFRAV